MEKLIFEEVVKLSFKQMQLLIPKVRDHGSLEDKEIASLACLKNFTLEQIQILQDLSNINCKDCVKCWFCRNCKDCVGCLGCWDCECCWFCIDCKICWLSVKLTSHTDYTNNKPNTLTKCIGKDRSDVRKFLIFLMGLLAIALIAMLPPALTILAKKFN